MTVVNEDTSGTYVLVATFFLYCVFSLRFSYTVVSFFVPWFSCSVGLKNSVLCAGGA